MGGSLLVHLWSDEPVLKALVVFGRTIVVILRDGL